MVCACRKVICWRLFAVTQGEMSWYAVWWLPGHPRSCSRRSKALLFTFWTRANFVSDESQARTIICHRQEIAFAVGEYHCAVRGITI